MNTTPLIVSLTDAWGPKFGGINAFNVELIRSLGIQPWRMFDVYNLVLQASAEDRADAARHHVELIDLDVTVRKFPPDTAGRIVSMLAQQLQNRPCIWLAHDTVSGALALQLRGLVANSRAAIIHHMAFGAYQDFKTGSSQKASEKRETQREIFKQADLCFAVGPMLRGQLADLLSAKPNGPAIEMLVPGLAEPDPEKVKISDSPPHNFTAFVAGRLGVEDDRIKQGALAVRAFGRATRAAFENDHADHALRRSPTLRMRGVPGDGHDEIRQLLSAASGRELNCDLGEYTEDRNIYFRDLASSSVAMMPSWHEGFGLAAWEAIACQVPVVIGEQSGVYRLLREDCQNMGLGMSVRSVAIAGQAGSESQHNHTEQDVSAVAETLLALGEHIETAKRNAATLPGNLRRQGYTWEGCVTTLVQGMQKHLNIQLKQDQPALSPIPVAPLQPPPSSAATPTFLRPPVARPWRADAGLAPSALLVARDKIVRFNRERDAVVNELLCWAGECATRIGLRVLSGPGGMGKTRTALEILARADGWQPLWLADELPGNWLEQWSRWLDANRGARALLVIDYADTQQDALLRLLGVALERVRGDAGPAALRVLLLTRDAGWWHKLAQLPNCTGEVAALFNGSANSGEQELPPWKNDPGVRAATYRAALKDYAAAQGRAVPLHTYLPDFSAPAFARPLFLHLAALASLEGERPNHAESLLASQLLREWRYCLKRHPHLECYDDWADALAWLGLVQSADVAHAATAFASLGIAQAGRLAQAFADTYPDVNGAITSLQPDLLVEALLKERLADARSARILDLAMPTDVTVTMASLAVIGRLAATVEPQPNEQTPRWHRALRDGLVLAWPVHGQMLIDIAQTAEIGLAQLLLEAWQVLPEDTQVKVAPVLSLPELSSTLLELAVAITRATLRATFSDDGRAQCLHNLGIRLSALGDAASRAEARACVFEAVDIYRTLAQEQPAAYRPYLATSLNNLAARFSERGDSAAHIEALHCVHESVEIYRILIKEKPTDYRLDLGMSLNNLSNCLSEQEGAASNTKALDCTREALSIFRTLEQEQTSAHRSNLAMTLHNLAIILTKQGDAASNTEALSCAREAVDIRSILAKQQPTAYKPDLASSMNCLAAILSKQDDAASNSEALGYAREAEGILRILAKQQPTAYEPDLASSMINLAEILSKQDDAASNSEALNYALDAVSIYETLAQTQPTGYLPELAVSLDILAKRFAEQGDAVSISAALDCARHRVDIYRTLAKHYPSAHQPNLAGGLTNLANSLADQDDLASYIEAFEYARESVSIYALLYEQVSTTYGHNFGMAGITLSRVAKALGLNTTAEIEKAARTLTSPAQGDDNSTH